jgi:hypothetical protein
VSIRAKRQGGRKTTSGHVGVTFCKLTSRWQARVTLSNGVRKFVGRGDTPVEAAALRDDYIAKRGTVDPRAKIATMTNGEGA